MDIDRGSQCENKHAFDRVHFGFYTYVCTKNAKTLTTTLLGELAAEWLVISPLPEA